MPTIHIKALFRKQLRPEHEVIVVNNKNPDILQNKYFALAHDMKYSMCSFEDLVSHENLLKDIMS